MVTWGVTDAGGPPAGDHSQDSDAGEDALSSFPDGQAGTVAGAPPRRSDTSEGTRTDGGLPPITVEPTPAGVATALSHASAGLATTGPPRSHPAYRDGPPPMTVGDETRVPARVRAATPDVDVSIEVPSSLSALFVVAPLAYYLPASVRTAEDSRPRICIDGSPRVEFEDLEADAATLLRRVFHLDCLVRAGPPGVGRRDGADGADGTERPLADVGLDAESMHPLSPGARLDRYLAAWEETKGLDLPDWHLSTAVEPAAEAVPSLPPLLDRLSVIHRPDGNARERSALLDRTLSSAYRTRGGGDGSGDVLAPRARPARSQAWLAPGRPLEAFKPTGSAFEHRRRYATDGDGSLSVAVVLADGRMTEEQERVAAVYHDCAAASSLTVDLVRSPTRAALKERFQRGQDFVHYVGHCDDEGLRCVDGHLQAADLSTCGTPTFFLNACGSYDEGLALVERGAVAGAVTFADVLDRHAARVGTTFARLLVSGFSVQRALELARRRILMGQDYAVVGDGTYAPWPNERPPGVLHVDATDDASDVADRGDRSDGESDAVSDSFRVTYDVGTVRTNGERHPAPFGDEDLLNGESVTSTLARDALCTLLDARSMPVIYEDDLLWTDDLRERFSV